MTNPKYATDGNEGRTYEIQGASFLSVTSILGCLAKPALVNAAAKEAGVRAVENVTTWQAIEQEEGKEEARKWISKAHRDKWGDKATMGSLVHYLCECYGGAVDIDKATWYCSQMRGEVGKLMERAFAHQQQYSQFLDDFDVTLWEQELTCYHPIGYAGTLDAIVSFGDSDDKYVLDIKTGSVWDSHALQLAAYRYAKHFIRDDGSTGDMPEIKGGFVLELHPKSYKLWRMDTSDYSFEIFLSLLDVKKWQARRLPASEMVTTEDKL